MLSARGPRPAWFTPRETGGSGDAFKRTGMDVLGTPRNQHAPASYQRADPAPAVAAAGLAGELQGGESVRGGLDVIVPTPRSPDLSAVQQRHRQKAGHPGERCLHWGLNDLKIPPPIEGYGVKSNKGESVEQNFRSGQQFGVAEYINARAEDVYYSTKREPLGKAYSRGHVMPPKVTSNGFQGFGNATETSDHSSKDAIFPRGIKPDPEEVRLQYKRTHGNTKPGEGLDRHYDWPDKVINNPIFRFGAAGNNEVGGRGSGAKAALTMDCGEEELSTKKTEIVQDSLAHFQEIRADRRGGSKILMQRENQYSLPDGHVFGKAGAAHNVTAASCIRGSYTLREQMPDPDLGKCVKVGKRNYETLTPRGVPSVRYDIVPPPPEKRSVANSTNFGDDMGAGSLINPTRFQFQGVSADDFSKRRSLAELRDLLGRAGAIMDPAEMDMVLEHAAIRHGDGEQSASLQSAVDSLTAWLSVQ
mmetsp:Transcript_48279/g.87077  ORF Transcript_48279/g.87077 Transcript_48279/m.87077 type:complete len:474 (+) Transcript_48279:59-1480(+)|eukprot:CAMPEP_0197655112 /NCGR_PEP_ID=MMETSP1338-20131121/39255_1 /TAXON_ID=43686 ORGANISM="Pelagodinium beii, Strain RCC1491" /NCGR_SAMPLE_ID=MMETSP1338 /ASSEMBLY_ACC=CAM_ASM_000754 /LENGTH=473 /DNA_ID=CAMNT_0043230693 /DNA_START=59 /DNA_END=1480 /DNA_ORIENTATION=+